MDGNQLPGTIVALPPGEFVEMVMPESVKLAQQIVEKFRDGERSAVESDLYDTACKCLAVFLSKAPIMCLTRENMLDA